MRIQSGMRLFGPAILLLGVTLTVPASAELRTTIIRVRATVPPEAPPAPAAGAPVAPQPATGLHKDVRIDERDRDYIPHNFPWCMRPDCCPPEFCPRGWCDEVPTECFRRDYARYIVRPGATDFSETPLDMAYYRRYQRLCRDSFNRP